MNNRFGKNNETSPITIILAEACEIERDSGPKLQND